STRSAKTFQGIARSISAKNFSRRVTLSLAWNSASEKLNWLIGGFLIGSRSTTYILTGPADLFRPSLNFKAAILMSTYFEKNIESKHRDAYWEDGKIFILSREGYNLSGEINWL